MFFFQKLRKILIQSFTNPFLLFRLFVSTAISDLASRSRFEPCWILVLSLVSASGLDSLPLMPRATTTNRISVMDSRVAELENSMASLKALVDASMASLPSLVDNAVAATLDTKLQLYFEQFRRELQFRPSGSGVTVPVIPNCPDSRPSAPDFRPLSPNHFGDDHPP